MYLRVCTPILPGSHAWRPSGALLLWSEVDLLHIALRDVETTLHGNHGVSREGGIKRNSQIVGLHLVTLKGRLRKWSVGLGAFWKQSQFCDRASCFLPLSRRKLSGTEIVIAKVAVIACVSRGWWMFGHSCVCGLHSKLATVCAQHDY